MVTSKAEAVEIKLFIDRQWGSIAQLVGYILCPVAQVQTPAQQIPCTGGKYLCCGVSSVKKKKKKNSEY